MTSALEREGEWGREGGWRITEVAARVSWTNCHALQRKKGGKKKKKRKLIQYCSITENSEFV
jgi:hypothetical protein